jgi:hypothetical protein
LDLTIFVRPRSISVAALIVLSTLSTACGPNGGSHGVSTASSTSPRTPPIAVDPDGLTAAEQAQVVATVTSAVASDLPLLQGWTIGVAPYPVNLPAPQINPFDGRVITQATSYTDFMTRHLELSWSRDGEGSIRVEDLTYELANVRCNCESGLLK